MADGFLGLGHDSVVGRHHQHGDVGYIRTAGPHFGKGLVSRRIDEGDRPAVLLHLIGADVLSNAALFFGYHVNADDPVQKRSLAVVDVPKEGDNGRAGLQSSRFVFGFQLGNELLFQIDLPFELHIHPQLHGQQFG